MLLFSRCLALALAIVSVVQGAAVCLTAQPRAPNAPSNLIISQALHAVVGSASANSPCAGFYKGNTAQRSVGSLVVQLSRDSAASKLDRPSCVKAFNRIIHDCIRRGTDWGGNDTSPGIRYAIYNKAFPQNWEPKRLPPSALSTKRPGNSSSKTPVATLLPPRPTGVRTSSRGRPTHASNYDTHTLSGVKGEPSSYSQTSTTDSQGHATTLPIWFDAAGAALIVVAVGGAGVAAGAAVPPPPAGFPPLEIGPDGKAKPSKDSSNDPENDTATQSSPSVSSHSRRTSHTSTPASSSTSANPTASTVAKYMIFPKNGKDPAVKEFTKELTEAFDKDAYTGSNPFSGVAFWIVNMTAEQAKHYGAASVVAGVVLSTSEHLSPSIKSAKVPPGPARRSVPRKANLEHHDGHNKAGSANWVSNLLEKRDPADPPNHQSEARPELVQISLPPPGQLSELSPLHQHYFWYDPAAGKGSTLYIISTGANPNDREYRSLRGAKRSLWAYVGADEYGEVISDPFGLGTCMLSKAVGNEFGVAKRTDVVVVKLRGTPNDNISIEDFFFALNLVATDMASKNIKSPVVTTGFIFVGVFSMAITAMQIVMTEMARAGVTFVVAGGDSQLGHGSVTGYPPLLKNDVPGMIVVGSSDINGVRLPTSASGSGITVYAPGYEMACGFIVDDVHGDSYNIGTGTTVAAATVAGIAAYLLTTDQFEHIFQADPTPETVPINMRALIFTLAYGRPGSTDKVVWNGYRPPVCTTSSGLARRAEACESKFSPLPDPRISRSVLTSRSASPASASSLSSPVAVLSTPTSVPPPPVPPSSRPPPPAPSPSYPIMPPVAPDPVTMQFPLVFSNTHHPKPC
ncbi:MAG: hypothetical protein M4579_005135 [Chaenotheca gracillima]|nr:MAG: hypothetical protein M4579_005135 [Chaenotheca gracillima]